MAAVVAERRLILILGGARSGKSTFAQQLAESLGEPVLFVATASAIDVEMVERIEAHRAARPGSWRCAEAPLNLGRAIREHGQGAQIVLVDCLSLLVSNCLVGPDHDQIDEHGDMGETSERVLEELEGTLAAAEEVDADLIVVSNEVGLGVVPAYPIGRAYRDLLGRANQRVAQAADAVYLMVAGIPVELKSLAARLS